MFSLGPCLTMPFRLESDVLNTRKSIDIFFPILKDTKLLIKFKAFKSYNYMKIFQVSNKMTQIQSISHTTQTDRVVKIVML